MSDSVSIRLGITQVVPCQYLEGEFERLVIMDPEEEHDDFRYRHLLSHGFRRCGDSLYAPHCPECNACQPIRLPVTSFVASRSQRRTEKLGKQHLTTVVSREIDRQEVFPLYCRYVETRHAEGSMNPVSYEQYENFLFSRWHSPLFVQFYDQEELVAVAVTDTLEDSLSAVYTFYDPDYSKLSLGTYAILRQLELAKSQQKPFLYLGFQIDDCPAMSYKIRYKPYQILQNGQWHQHE
ncbi:MULTISPECIES: arginyltransferase [Corallincola]|uniref:Aspartate/glutamate leucyltransferase n=3 Tax=Corallincola TaxID=1775176 RepID=A0A368NQK6_9GAMM|nr:MULTISPECIES: arginyltransferase [Corallincola]RCU52426.1 arginyltransferase [Corallincola holothuriorum]TAA48383.1 arginyltransferase [Corallincola spongiicola]TCI01350.1 arginyltransferase [Corallincola luteus]